MGFVRGLFHLEFTAVPSLQRINCPDYRPEHEPSKAQAAPNWCPLRLAWEHPRGLGRSAAAVQPAKWKNDVLHRFDTLPKDGTCFHRRAGQNIHGIPAIKEF